MESERQTVSFKAGSRNFTYTIAIEFVCERFHGLVPRKVSQVPPALHPGELVTYISDAPVAFRVRVAAVVLVYKSSLLISIVGLAGGILS
jgi:hypothetical protein